MNWNNIPAVKFKLYDFELKKFILDGDIAPLINSGPNTFTDKMKDRYFICYGHSGGLVFGYYNKQQDWEECKIFPWSGMEDKNRRELYLYDRVKHTDSEFKGVIDIEHGKWVIRYDSQRTVPLADRVEYIVFSDDPELDS